MSSGEIDTIVAPATPRGRSALAVVRIDGPRAVEILSQLAGGRDDFPERRASLAGLADAGETLDEAVITRFASPRSFTGNDLVEISLHGSPFLVDRLITAVTRLGARIAEPGEFTERAVLNGKLDLVQAESIADLISSRTSLQAKLSLGNLGGRLSRVAGSLREQLLFIISRLEAALDFADEGYEFITRPDAVERINALLAAVRELSSSYERGRATTRGLLAVILGLPNAGKSTLLNHLCGSDRAIVTPIPGTTRDLLRETIEIGGLPVTLVDTAGLRVDAEIVEEIGIRRARDVAGEADLLLYLIDASRGATEEDRAEIAVLRDPLLIYTKIDLQPAPEGVPSISVESGEGMSELLSRLDSLVKERYVPPDESATIVNLRQRRAMEECEEALEAARQSLIDGLEEEVVVVDLFRASNAIAALTGAISRQDVLHEIFAKFCIGK